MYCQFLQYCVFFLKAIWSCPGWCGSVDWVLVCEPKGCQFESQSGHMPVLRVRSPVGGAGEVTTHWCLSPSLSPSLSLSVKIINKVFKKTKATCSCSCCMCFAVGSNYLQAMWLWIDFESWGIFHFPCGNKSGSLINPGDQGWRWIWAWIACWCLRTTSDGELK